MRKLFILLSLFLVSISSQAQKSFLKISPFHFFDGTLKMSYERPISSDKSINISGGFHLIEDGGWNYGDQIGWMGEIQLRKYLVIQEKKESKLSGIYVAPYFKGGYFRYKEDNGYYLATYDNNGYYIEDIWHYNTDEYEIKNYNVGILMGAQIILSNIVSLEIFLGGGVQYADIEDIRGNLPYYYNDTPFSRGYTGVVPKAGFNFGVKF